MMTSHNWLEYQLPKTICGDILHHTVKVLSEILHYAVPDHSLWLLQYYGSLAWRVDGKSLCRPHALPNNLEHCVELSRYYLFVYLGCRAPEHPLPEEARCERDEIEL